MKKFALILVILAGIVFLTGCYCCPTCSPVNQSCSLKITTGDWVWEDLLKNVWGTVYVNGQSTGQDIHYLLKPEVIISNVPCNQTIYVYIVDSCGNQSHTETIYISPGQNYLYFAYWKNNKDKQNDFHSKCSQ